MIDDGDDGDDDDDVQVSRENIRSAGDRAFLVSREMDGTTRQ